MRTWLAVLLVTACSEKPSSTATKDVCPIDDVFDDDWPGCPDHPFFKDERILNAGNPLPCEETRFDTSGSELGTVEFVLDDDGRLSMVRDRYDGGGSSRLTYHYDAAGRRVGAEFDGRRSVRWTYERDAHGRLVKATQLPTDNIDGPEVTSYQRDDAGRPLAIDNRSGSETVHTAITWRDGVVATSTTDVQARDGTSSRTTTTVTRDPQGRRTELQRTTGTKVQTVRFVYDPNGHVVEIRDGDAVKTISYDRAGRISHIKGPYGASHFVYCDR